ncbi:MAG: phage holin family protein [Actinomycetota bacterium]|nr:phage holin family protein [Actinomycetota bacterium]
MSTPPNQTPELNQAPERSLGQLVADASADLSSIMRSEIELVKVEVKNDVSQAGKGAGMFAGAAVLGLYGFGLLLLAAAWGLEAAGLPVWLGLLIVAVLLFVIAAVLALIGKKAMAKVKGKPEKTIENAQQAVQAVKPRSR